MRREADFFGAMFEAADFETYLADMRRTKTWGDARTLTLTLTLTLILP